MNDDHKWNLTQTVQKGGCAAKIPATELRGLLEQVRFPAPHPELLVDGRLFDDAGIYKISESLALVQTLDFFTPILDSPKHFGAVAAANALSDVYAMGGRPKTAMGILAYPSATMPNAVIVEVMQGASDIVAEAGANFVGGHSIDDETLKFGLSVTGFVNPSRLWRNSGARVGDHLILTKALGTGTLTAALKRRLCTEDQMKDVIASMSQLNNVVDFLDDDEQLAIHAATDVTGFGLSGHALQLARASGVSLRITTADLPVFAKALEFLDQRILTKAHRTNAEYVRSAIQGESLSPLLRELIHDPQTSGGLLLCVDPNLSSRVVERLRRQFSSVRIIGTVAAQSPARIIFD